MDTIKENLKDLAGKVDVVSLCQDIIRIKSINPPGDELAVANFCADFLRKIGFEVKLLQHTSKRASVLARKMGVGKALGVMVCAHMDTVPLGAITWEHDALGGELADGKIWGRGASDMKGGLAAGLAAAQVVVESDLPLQGDLWIGLTAGEEADFLGAKEIAKSHEIGPLQVLLIPEPSSNHIYLAQKGALWLEVITEGKTAHGSMPDLGVNAVELMTEFIQRFKQLEFPYQPHPLLDKYTSAVTMAKGGMKINVIPDECSITLDIRTMPGQNHANMLNQIRGLLNSLKKSTPGLKTRLHVLKDLPAVTTHVDHPAVRTLREAARSVTGREAPVEGVRYFTDSAILTPAWDVPMIICGPGHAGLAHQPDEYVDVDLLREAVEIYSLALVDYLG